MDFADKIAALAQRIAKQKDAIDTEEATKTAFIMPFLRDLGYDVFDPHVVVPEFTADVGVKKGEKVDYAIKLDGKVVMLVECKPCKGALSTQHMSQLYRYFSVTEARFGILTNGIVYWFFTDLEQANKMDAKPFFEFDMLNYRPAQIEELKKFVIGNFDVTTILETASDLKYGSLLMREIANEIDAPSDEVMRLLIGRVYDGKLTSNVLAKFGPLVQKAMKDTVRELVNQRLSSAMDDTAKIALPVTPSEMIKLDASAVVETPADSTRELDDIVTTQEEIDGYQIVRAIVREVVKVERVIMRDAKSYCAILLDDNNRKPLCRLHLNRGVKYLGLFDEGKNEERVRIESLDDIFAYANRLKATAVSYGDALK
ncbi:MAG: type I restriction enzyme HsdR N-terminal domain-containing protein [Magnetospirillum sp.]|nr:type I restriction enzyme HsdR N-terminal domain-containing protein [Magnetospirillum sp.]